MSPHQNLRLTLQPPSLLLLPGVEAIIIAMEQVERHTEIKGELPEVKCPVICVSHETVGALGDGQVMKNVSVSVAVAASPALSVGLFVSNTHSLTSSPQRSSFPFPSLGYTQTST